MSVGKPFGQKKMLDRGSSLVSIELGTRPEHGLAPFKRPGR
jgi:hypothetical protein